VTDLAVAAKCFDDLVRLLDSVFREKSGEGVRFIAQISIA
jgi:hypothetical protein